MELYRIGVVGTKRPNRKYVVDTERELRVEANRRAALHWPKLEAKALANQFNYINTRRGSEDRFQIERAT